MDGCGTFHTFFRIILPLSIPMMITVFLFAFCWQWTDDFYIPLFFTTSRPAFMTNIAKVLPLDSLTATYANVTGSAGGYLSAMKYGCGLMACLPLIILYLFCQKYLVQGIERSGIVG
jgi:multiple sugar transport system permease protein